MFNKCQYHCTDNSIHPRCTVLLYIVDTKDHRLTVLCSSPSLTWNVCSKMVYMILPMPKEGSITLGTTSSTADDKDRQKMFYRIYIKHTPHMIWFYLWV